MNNLIISAVGSDRPGIVSEISGVITSHGGNVEESRMSRLGSDFAIIMLVTVAPDWEESLEVALKSITELTITTKPTKLTQVGDGRKYKIDLIGADNEGIVKVLSKYLAKKSINILEMETYISEAPISGTPLFNLNATVSIPSDVEEKGIQSDLSQSSPVAQTLGGQLKDPETVTLPALKGRRTILIVEKLVHTAAQYPRRTGLPNKRPIRIDDKYDRN